MPRSHKPRKRFIPKRQFDAAISAIERAQMQQHRARLTRSQASMDATQVRDLAMYCHSAVFAISHGEGTEDHTNHLALAMNISLLLCELNIGGEWIDKVREAQDALVTLEARHQRIGRYVISGPELQRLNTLLELHEAQLASADCTEGVMVRALGEIKRRVEIGAVVEVRAI